MTPRKPTHNALTKAEANRFTPQQVERSLLKALAPALAAKSGSVHSFAEWTLAGHGIVLVLSTGQEFWLTLAEASY
jgi:hypothetical protein